MLWVRTRATSLFPSSSAPFSPEIPSSSGVEGSKPLLRRQSDSSTSQKVLFMPPGGEK